MEPQIQPIIATVNSIRATASGKFREIMMCSEDGGATRIFLTIHLPTELASGVAVGGKYEVNITKPVE